MSKLHGKQIKQSSIALNKLTGGEVSFDSTAEMNFLTGARLFYIDAPTVDTELVNKKYVDDQVFAASEDAVYQAGAGLDLDGLVFSHEDTSTQVSSNNSGRTYIQDIVLDTYGHITGITTATETVTDTNTEYTAGNGLELIGLDFSVNVNEDALTINNDTVTLKNTIIGNRTFSNNLIVDGDFTVNGTTTFVNTTQLEITDNIITLAKGNSAGSGVDAGIEIDRGTNPLANLIWDESASVWVAGTAGSELALLTNVGTGLSRNNNVVSLDTTQVAIDLAGLGLTNNGSKIDVDLATNPGLVFDGNGLKANIDNSTLIINASGQIEVDNSFLNATPVYDLTTLATSYTSNNSVTTIALSATPSDFSRVSVLVNGQKQKVADGTNSLDAYFVASSATGVPLALDDLDIGDLLVWNAGNAGFSLESGDDVEIIYEA